MSTAIKKAGVSSYKEAYTFANDGFKYGLGSLTTGDELTADDLAKGNAALELIGKDIVAMQKTYTADSTAFVEAVKAYQKTQKPMDLPHRYPLLIKMRLLIRLGMNMRMLRKHINWMLM